MAGGSLTLTPTPNTAWHMAQQASQYYQMVEGNFAVTASVTVTNGSGGPVVPAWRLAGLMMRDPGATSNTYHGAFGTVGAWINPNMVFEWKNTVSNATTLGAVTNASGSGQIRLCRVGADVRTLFRPDGSSTWTLVNQQLRTDFGSELAVGPISFSLNNPVAFQARFDWVDYATIGSMDECGTVGVQFLEADAAANDLVAATPSAAAEADAAGGCGCTTSGRGGFAPALLLLGLLGLRRPRS